RKRIQRALERWLQRAAVRVLPSPRRLRGPTAKGNTMTTIRRGMLVLALAGAAAPGTALADGTAADVHAARADIGKALGFVPQFMLAMPDEALPGVWDEMKTLQLNPA